MSEHKRYCLVWDAESFTDGQEFDDFDEAVRTMKDIYTSWIGSEQMFWNFGKGYGEEYVPLPTEKQIEAWDYMIENCICWIAEWKEDEKTYYDEKMNYFFLSDDECGALDWLIWDEFKAKYGWR